MELITPEPGPAGHRLAHGCPVRARHLQTRARAGQLHAPTPGPSAGPRDLGPQACQPHVRAQAPLPSSSVSHPNWPTKPSNPRPLIDPKVTSGPISPSRPPNPQNHLSPTEPASLTRLPSHRPAAPSFSR